MKLTIKKETVVKLFEVLGFKTAKTWDEKRLQKKLKNLPELVDETKIKNPKTKKLLKTILKADKVVFKESEPERPNEKAMRKTDGGRKKPKITKKKTTKKKAAKKTSKEKSKDVDSFGNCLSSNAAAINKCLGKKPKSMKQLVKEAKLTGTFYEHLNGLVKKKFVKKTEKGFILATKTK